jgi:hypothetical protein
MKNKMNVNWLRIGIWVFVAVIVIFIITWGVQRVLAPSGPNGQTANPSSTSPFGTDPIQVKAFLDLPSDQKLQVFLGETDISLPGTEVKIKPGIYMLRIVDETGREHQEPVYLDEKNTEIRKTITMPPERRTILIRTDLDLCDFYLNGKFEMSFNQETTVMFPHGKHTIEIRKEGYQSQNKTIEVNAQTSDEIIIKLVATN